MEEIEDNSYTRYQFKAFLGHHLTFANYLGSYNRAFEVLMMSVYNSSAHVDHLAYPLLFIARHCMELGFKTNIRYFCQYSGKEDFKKAGTHNLEDLFKAFRLHLYATIENLNDKYGIEVSPDDVKEFDNYCNEVYKLTAIFHKLDEGSDSFRYPVDKKNNNSFGHTDTINLLDVKELFEKSMLLFVHTADVFARYTDFADEIENMYEQEMRQYYEY
ncbi:hypothetical protein [Runella salmonicolor]|uniref:HEPN domain-containing protein n=1 Tax=Runella salmonicolor TaxID=2950278 RepID=A0ABT1FQZ9_9BACT|nr:hypothetical protein [Runella salmonicolor]MCP1384201.1 hypothetical protein [Runella salmonicolor]